MAVAIAGSVSEYSFTGAGGTTGNFTSTTGRRMLVAILQYRFPIAVQPAAVTHNGVSLTKAHGHDGTIDQDNWWACSLWHLDVSSGATAGIAIDPAGQPSDTEFIVVAWEVTGSDGTTPIGDVDQGNQDNAGATGDPPGLTLTSASGDMVVYMVASEGAKTLDGSITPLGTQTGLGYVVASGASTAVSATLSPTGRGYVDVGVVIKATVGSGGGGDGTDLPLYHFGVRPTYPNIGRKIAAQEAGLRFIDAPDPPILPQYVFGAQPVRRPKAAPNPGGIWMPSRLPDTAPVVLSDLPCYWYFTAPRRRSDPGRTSRATVAIVQTPQAPTAPPQPSYRFQALRPRYPDPQALVERLTLGQRLVDATVPTPPPAADSGGSIIPVIRRRRRLRRRRK